MARVPLPPRPPQKSQSEMNYYIIDNEEFVSHQDAEETHTQYVPSKAPPMSQMEKTMLLSRVLTNLYNEDAKKRGISFERSTKQLMRSYNYMKSKVRDQDSDVKRHKLAGTGGGPPLPENAEQIDELVRGIKPHIDFTLENQFDSTSQFEDDFASSTVEDYTNSNEIDLPFSTHDDDVKIDGDELDMLEPTIDNDPTKSYGQNLSDASKGEFIVITSDEEIEAQYRAMKNSKQQKDGHEPNSSQRTNSGEQINPQRDVENDFKVSSDVANTQKRVPFKNLQQVDNFLDGNHSVRRVTLKPLPLTATKLGILQKRLRKVQEQQKLGYSRESSDSPSPKSVPKRSPSAAISSQEEEERLQKLKEARAQQYEIHRKRMELLQKEEELLNTKIQVTKLERDVKILERQAAQLKLQFMSHEVDQSAEG
ncbi:hypothetical protein QAD02_022336 [Eretmocerus hayati]|uniref:Uncharacterized protein n=1 Tax=Eretmocerus hayati TaxID=131215 RepID=A0ACC2PSZ4_9HYME|nr:hypothetical protein QAD02_022336 [Eretmocerus hayati]